MAVTTTLVSPLYFRTCGGSQSLQHCRKSVFCSAKAWQSRSPNSFTRLVVFSSGDETTGNEEEGGEVISSDGLGEFRKNGRSSLNIRWQDLLNPDPENILAVGLTGVLTWASVQHIDLQKPLLSSILLYQLSSLLLFFVLCYMSPSYMLHAHYNRAIFT